MQIAVTFHFKRDKVTKGRFKMIKNIETTLVTPSESLEVLNANRVKRPHTQEMEIYLCNGAIKLDVIDLKNMTLSDVKNLLYEVHEMESNLENTLSIIQKKEVKK